MKTQQDYSVASTTQGHEVRCKADGDWIATFPTEVSAYHFINRLTETADEKLASAQAILRHEYHKDVRDTAQSILEELDEQIRDGERGETLREWLMEHIHETIDGHARVIYTHKAQQTLWMSDHDGAYFEQFGTEGSVVSDGCINWSALAYSALEADVLAHLDAFGLDVNEPDKDLYEVIVGNIGTVLTTRDETRARETYAEYVTQSLAGSGRAGNEPVTLWFDGHIVDEHLVSEDEDEEQEQTETL